MSSLLDLLLVPPVSFALTAAVVVIAWRSRVLRQRAPARTADAAAEGPSFGPAEVALCTAAGLALAGVAAWQGAPLGPPADPDVAPSPPRTVWFLAASQELRLYFEPWFANRLWPALWLGLLLALPWLEAPIDREEHRRWPARLVLAAGLLLWLWPMTVAGWMRGPGWGFADAGEPPPALPLSDLVWGRTPPPESPWVRELPGFALLGLYLAVLPWTLSRWRPTRRLLVAWRERLGPLRFRALAAVGLVFLVVPLKMYGRWLLGIGHWLSLPEIGLLF